jgi:hypothetical protein
MTLTNWFHYPDAVVLTSLAESTMFKWRTTELQSEKR